MRLVSGIVLLSLCVAGTQFFLYAEDTTHPLLSNSVTTPATSLPDSQVRSQESDTVQADGVVTGQDAGRSSSDTSTMSSTGTKTPSLDRMVVSATRTRRRISETPASVPVIDRLEIHYRTADGITLTT